MILFIKGKKLSNLLGCKWKPTSSMICRRIMIQKITASLPQNGSTNKQTNNKKIQKEDFHFSTLCRSAQWPNCCSNYILIIVMSYIVKVTKALLWPLPKTYSLTTDSNYFLFYHLHTQFYKKKLSFTRKKKDV